MNHRCNKTNLVLNDKLKPYPAYRDSGVEWLGKIPAHWEVNALKRIGNLQAGAGFPEIEQGDKTQQIPFFKVGDMGLACNVREMRQYQHTVSVTTAVRLRAHVFTPNTIVFAKVGAALLLNRRRVLMRPSCIDNNMMGFSPYSCDSVWAMYWLSALDMKELANPGAVPFVNESQMRETPVVIGPLPEQRAIADFLDRETARIDALVAKKERLIDLLQEKRSALISHTVTRGLPADAAAQAGLDPTVPMKDSRVEWLGEVPAHWEIVPVYVRYEVALGKMLNLKRIRGDWLGKYIRNIDVQWDSVNTRDLPQMDFGPVERDRYRLELGDLLVCEGGEVGRTAVWQGALEECFYQKAIHRVRPRSQRDVPRFFYYVMYSLAKRGVFVAGSNPNTINHLTAIQLSHYRLIFPPSDEQYAIVKFLDRETAKIDALVTRVREAIDRLKELRQALISAALTGKIDVSNSL